MTVPRPATIELLTADGVTLAADVAVPDRPLAAVVLAHPHPRFGGSRHAGAIDVLFGSLPPAGVATLRFDFRGAGGSGGDHGGGGPEAEDVAAATRHLHDLTGLPVWLVGWSFGGDVSMQVGDGVVAGWVAVAAPLSVVDTSLMVAPDDPRPTRLLVPEHDQFLSPDAARRRTADWTNTTVETLGGTDHFLAGRVAEVHRAVLAAVGA